MTTLTFDTYEFIKKLKDVGFSEEQASVITELQKTALQGNREQITHDYGLDDLLSNKDLDARIRETELKIELVRSELKRDIAESKADLIKINRINYKIQYLCS